MEHFGFPFNTVAMAGISVSISVTPPVLRYILSKASISTTYIATVNIFLSFKVSY